MAFPVPFALLALQTGGMQQMLPFLFALKRGDEIVTAGGLVGEVSAIQQGLKDGQPTPTLEDRVTIKSGESKVVVQRGRIAAVLGDGGTSAPAQG